MKNRMLIISLIFTLCSLVPAAKMAAGLQQSQDSYLRIYLPREVSIDGEDVRLGRIGILKGPQEMVKGAQNIRLGNLAVVTGQISLSRAMILGRLAGSGIDISKVKITGAEKVVVSQNSIVIKADRMQEIAKSFLSGKLSAGSDCKFNALAGVKDFKLPVDAKHVELVAGLVGDKVGNKPVVQVAIMADGKKVGYRNVKFSLLYSCQKIVAARDIAVGERLTKANTKIVRVNSTGNKPIEYLVPYGFVASIAIKSEAEITKGMVVNPISEVLVKRNKNVSVVISKPGLYLTATGKAMDDGRVGDCIRVKMLISNTTRIIYAKINNNGTVEPVM